MLEELEKWRLASAEWLDLQEAADILRETKNDVFAEIVSRMEGSSHAERDRLARLTSEWREFRDEMVKAESAARRAKFRVKYSDMKWNSLRSMSANQRAERGHQQ